MKNENGLTLIEILATLLIVSIILIVTFSIVVQSKNEQTQQMNDLVTLNKNSYVFKQLTSDIRETIDIDINGTEILLTKKNQPSVIYEFNKSLNMLYRNNSVIASDLKAFELNPSTRSIEIKIENLNDEILQTIIYIRGDS